MGDAMDGMMTHWHGNVKISDAASFGVPWLVGFYKVTRERAADVLRRVNAGERVSFETAEFGRVTIERNKE